MTGEAGVDGCTAEIVLLRLEDDERVRSKVATAGLHCGLRRPHRSHCRMNREAFGVRATRCTAVYSSVMLTRQIYKCQSASCPPPGCYRSYPSSKEANPKCERPGCDGRMELLR
jgi:hypothetical protein